MTTLSTHVLDTANGCPAAGMRVALMHDERILFEGKTDGDGRCPDLGKIGVMAGVYKLCFSVADYFRSYGHVLPEPPFLDEVRIDFGMSDAGHYHVPLLVSPFGYSTYRGS